MINNLTEKKKIWKAIWKAKNKDRQREYQRKYWDKKAIELKQMRENFVEKEIEIDPKMIKNRCVACGSKFENTIEDYAFRGNYCEKCSTDCHQNSHLKLSTFLFWKPLQRKKG